MQTTVSTSIGKLQVDMIDANRIVVTTPYVGSTNEPVVINGVEYTLRYTFERVNEPSEYGYGTDKRWRIENNYGKLQRNGWANWNKPVSDSAYRKARAAVNEAVIAVDTQDNAASANVDAARYRIARCEQKVEDAKRVLLGLEAELFEAHCALAAAEVEAGMEVTA